MFLQDGILMDHSSQRLLLTPFIKLFLYPWKVTLVFVPFNEFVQNLPSANRNEWERLWFMSYRRNGPIHPLIYPHPITQKRVQFKMGVLYCFLCVDSTWSTVVKRVWTLQRIYNKKASLFHNTSEKSSKFPLPVT